MISANLQKDGAMNRRKYNSYLLAGLFLVVISAILIENRYLLINQIESALSQTKYLVRDNLFKLIEVGAQKYIESVHLTPLKIERHIKKLVTKIDDLNFKTNPQKFLQQNKLRSVAIFDENGQLQGRFSRKMTIGARLLPDSLLLPQIVPGQERSGISNITTITLKRVNNPGTIQIKFGAEKLSDIKAQIGLQLLIASLENQEIITYASFINDQMMIIADYEPEQIGSIEDREEYENSLAIGADYFIPAEDSLEIIFPLDFTQNTRGVVKIAFQPPTGIEQIYRSATKITDINSIGIMLLAVVAIAIMLQLFQRNMRKIDFMQKKIAENEKLVSLANLTAGVAHEVRNPLNSISITIQRLQLEFNPKHDTDLEEYRYLTTTMKKEVDRINTIITDLLDFTKPFSPKKTYFSLGAFLNENISLFNGEAKNKNVTVHNKHNTDNVQFFGDQQKLTQVLINILHNALDATPENGTITIYSDIIKDRTWLLKVEDSGVGISKKDLRHIFDIYFTTKDTGSGLGLYITRKIIQAHGGTIDLTPNSDKGITVIVSLPNTNQ